MARSGLICVLAAAVCSFAADPIPRADYKSRRAELRKKLDGTLVLFGWTEGHDQVYRTPQGSNFYYLTGWNEPGAVLLLTPTDEKFFVPHRNERLEVYNGRRTAPGDADAGERTGFDTVLPLERFESSLRDALDRHLAFYAQGDTEQLAKLKALVVFREIRNPERTLADYQAVRSVE